MKYTPDEIRQLKALGEVPQDLEINENEGPNDGQGGIEFFDNPGEAGSDDSSSSSESESKSDDDDDFGMSKETTGKKKLEQVDIDNIWWINCIVLWFFFDCLLWRFLEIAR